MTGFLHNTCGYSKGWQGDYIQYRMALNRWRDNCSHCSHVIIHRLPFMYFYKYIDQVYHCSDCTIWPTHTRWEHSLLVSYCKLIQGSISSRLGLVCPYCCQQAWREWVQLMKIMCAWLHRVLSAIVPIEKAELTHLTFWAAPWQQPSYQWNETADQAYVLLHHCPCSQFNCVCTNHNTQWLCNYMIRGCIYIGLPCMYDDSLFFVCTSL